MDYKKFGDLLYATRSKQKAAGQDLEIAITSISFDEPIPNEYFDLPAEIKAKLPKQPGAVK